MRALAGLIPVFVLAAAVAGGQAAERGLNNAIRAGEEADAPVLETHRLYDTSLALIIGIDDYVNGWPRLANAVNDARAVAEALAERGFETTLLTDLGGSELETALEEFFVLAGDDPVRTLRPI